MIIRVDNKEKEELKNEAGGRQFIWRNIRETDLQMYNRILGGKDVLSLEDLLLPGLKSSGSTYKRK